MESIFIISGIIVLIIIIGILIFFDRLRRFNRAINIQIFTHLSVIRDVFSTHPDIEEQYLRDIDALRRLNPLEDNSLNDLFMFDRHSNFKERIESLNKEINESHSAT